MSKPAVSVIVTVHNRRERMMRCIDSVLALDHGDFEFVIVDNESTDGTAEACMERARDARVPMRVAVAAGSIGRVHNVGAQLAEGEILAFTDSDCLPTPGWLAAGTAPFAADPKVGIVQGPTLPEPGVELGSWPATIEVPDFSGRFEGCNLFVRRKAFAASRGFLETVRHFWSDTVLGFDIVRDGWEPAFAPEALVYHDVTHPGLAWHIRHRALRYGDIAAAVEAAPYLRDDLLWRHWFLRPRSAAVTLAVAGLAGSVVDRRLAAAALPWLWLRTPADPRRANLIAAGEDAVWDLAVFADLVRGSVRHRTPVL